MVSFVTNLGDYQTFSLMMRMRIQQKRMIAMIEKQMQRAAAEFERVREQTKDDGTSVQDLEAQPASGDSKENDAPVSLDGLRIEAID